jgi:hypothetical protein
MCLTNLKEPMIAIRYNYLMIMEIVHKVRNDRAMVQCARKKNNYVRVVQQYYI